MTQVSGTYDELYHELRVYFPPEELLDRICNKDDLAFASESGHTVRRTFLRERRAVSILWLEEAERCATSLYRLHRLVSRNVASMELMSEVQLLAHFISFRILVFLSKGLVSIAGPFRVRRIFGTAVSSIENISEAVAAVLATLDPAQRATLRTEWIGRVRATS
jgi:hypothetical protein